MTLTLCFGEMYDNRSRPENKYTPLPSPPCPCLELAEHLLGSKLVSGLGLGLCCAGAEGRGLLAPPPGTAPHRSVGPAALRSQETAEATAGLQCPKHLAKCEPTTGSSPGEAGEDLGCEQGNNLRESVGEAFVPGPSA